MHKKKSTGALGLGSVSVVVIFSVLCLTVFAVLSLTTARNGRELAEVSARAISDYYAADLRCSQMTQELLDCWEQQGTLPAVERLAEELGADCLWDGPRLEISFVQKMTESQELVVRLSFSELEQLEILQWQLRQSGQWVPDESLPVWEGA